MTMLTSTKISRAAQSPDATSAPQRFEHLDGLRGLAATYVLLHHAFLIALLPRFHPMPAAIKHLVSFLAFGRAGVATFIVLSGYCLMLPVARDGALRGGLLGFVKRRSRRILPPYYFALACSLLLLLLPPLNRVPSDIWSAEIGSFRSFGVIASHLFLVHNLVPSWEYKIDGPMWSVATEWQIYFLFALILLPIWQRFGNIASLVAAIVLGIGPHYILHGRIDGAAPQFVILFCFGMIAATFHRTRQPAPHRWVGSAAIMVLLYVLGARRYYFDSWRMDVIVGLAAAFFLVGAADGKYVRLLVTRPIVKLGEFSYSIYLTHFPILLVLTCLLLPLKLSSEAMLAALIFLACPCTLAIAYLFHLPFEKPFMRLPQRGDRAR